MNEPDPAADVPTQDEKTWGMLAHLTAFSGFLIPLGSVLGPLIVWLVKRDESAFVADQGKEALNFNISVLLAACVCAALVWVLLIGVLLGVVLFLYWLAMTIIAAIKASEGIRYRHPFTLRLIQ